MCAHFSLKAFMLLDGAGRYAQQVKFSVNAFFVIVGGWVDHFNFKHGLGFLYKLRVGLGAGRMSPSRASQ
jgi:hypothetical protein